MSYTSNSFKSIKAKINRADKHLSELKTIDSQYKSVECSLSIENDSKDLSYLSFNLPSPPNEVSTIVGDCLNNLRSSLDYLIWQIVESNQIAKPSRRNQFPICDSKQYFEGELKGKRLQGVPQPAIDQIARLQPYADIQNEVLGLLNELCNKDKHRNLNYSISVASDVVLQFSRNGLNVFSSIIGNDEIKNGEVFGNIGFNPSMFNGIDVEIKGRAKAYLAFQDQESGFSEAIPVVDTLQKISDFVKYEAVDPLVKYLA